MINLGRRVIFSSINTKRYLSSSKEPVWHKSSSAQATIILIGCVAFEFFYGSITESIWESLNKGVRLRL